MAHKVKIYYLDKQQAVGGEQGSSIDPPTEDSSFLALIAGCVGKKNIS